ncbi:MAG: HAMP domain-containing histidine kinase [Ignavibacteria bacterium]|nr:HAMP domain-containing histidine kinase [Ignavibacteria bacterium]
MQSPKRINKRINFSIFLKLILLIIVFTVLVNLSIGFIVRMSFEGGPFRPPNKLSYGFNDYFIKDIGDPPDTIKARSILKDMGLNIRFETSNSNWASSPDIPTINELRNERGFDDEKPKFTIRDRTRFYEVVRTDNGYIIFAPPRPRDEIDLEKAIIPVIIMITVLAALLYFSLRWIFGPVKKLSEAVGQISAGNFDVPIDIKRNDELGKLADSINEMKVNISNMIKSKESLLIDVSHELRSPLTRIKLANEFVEDEKIKNKIRDDVNEMEAMVSGLLETYRTENVNGKLNARNTDIVLLMKDLIPKFGNALINLNSELTEKIINIDKEKIETVLRNIIDNAVKYSNGKPVEVTVSDNPLNKDETFIFIKDKGRGIESEEIKKIFEPFYRIDKSRDKKITGYGLGLSIVKKILDMHNSSVEINSKPFHGTEFKITLRGI